jgi:hypothetical protein
MIISNRFGKSSRPSSKTDCQRSSRASQRLGSCPLRYFRLNPDSGQIRPGTERPEWATSRSSCAVKDPFTSTPMPFDEPLMTVASGYQHWYSWRMAGLRILKVFRVVSLLCLCIVGVAVVVVPLELVAYPILQSIGCGWSNGQQRFACAGGWLGDIMSTVLNLPINFSNGSVSFGRGITVYLFDAIFILALAYPLLILFARKGGRRSS